MALIKMFVRWDRNHNDWIMEPLPFTSPEQTSKIIVSFAEQISAILYWCIFVIFGRGAANCSACLLFVLIQVFPCEYAINLDMYENIDTYHVKDNTWKRATYMSPLFHLHTICIFYTNCSIRIPLTQLSQRMI